MEVLLAEAVRSPMCHSPAQKVSMPAPMELVRQTVDALLERAGIEATSVDRVLVECGSNVAGQLEAAGSLSWPVDALPMHVPRTTIGSWCGTGQRVVQAAARAIGSGKYDSVVVVGVESTTECRSLESTVEAPDLQATNGFRPRILAAELLAAKLGIDREQLDEYAVRSHQRASEVAACGEFDAEIVAIRTQNDISPAVSCDQTIDPSLTVERLRALRPTVHDSAITSRHPDITWSITAGNSARPAIGTSAVLLMSKVRATQLELRPRARFRGFTVARGEATAPLAAPLQATERVLAGTKLSLPQIDHVEVDEEFACVPLAWTKQFSINPDLLNPRGGALALGNPRACGGLRQLTTMLGALEATGGRLGLQTMSSGASNAYACLVEYLRA